MRTIKAFAMFGALAAVAILAVSCNPLTWTTIYSQDFEGAFPGTGEAVFDQDPASSGEYYWAKSDHRAASGSYSAWAIGGGANGSVLAPGAIYPAGAASWMVLGPFDLTTARGIYVTTKLFCNTEPDRDYILFGYSTTGTAPASFQVKGLSGASSGWYTWSVPVGEIQDAILGKPAVYFCFVFKSSGDGLYLNSDGVYIDDIKIQRGD